jgi:hypothetical protein
MSPCGTCNAIKVASGEMDVASAAIDDDLTAIDVVSAIDVTSVASAFASAVIINVLASIAIDLRRVGCNRGASVKCLLSFPPIHVEVHHYNIICLWQRINMKQELHSTDSKEY